MSIPLSMVMPWPVACLRRCRARPRTARTFEVLAYGQVLNHPHRVRIATTDAELRTLDESVERWATANVAAP